MSNLPATNTVTTIRDLLNKAKPQIAMALPKHMSPDRMLRIAMTSIQKSYRLPECHPTSLVAAVIEASQLGLEPDGVLGYAYLVPYKVKGVYRAQLQIGYRGFIDLAYRSGRVTKIYAQVVHANDKYDIAFGLQPKLLHVPTSSEDEGEIIAAYAVVHFKEGEPDFEWMWKKDIDKIRKGSQAADDGPWVTHYAEMAKKTTIRRLAKRLPLSPEFQKAAVVDEYVEAGIQNVTNGIIVEPTMIEEKSAVKLEELKGKLKTAKDLPGEKVSEKSKYKTYLEDMAEVKKEINNITRNDDDYYAALSIYEIKHANQMKDLKQGNQLLKDLKNHLKTLKKEDKEPALQYDCPDQLDEEGNPISVLALQCSQCDKLDGCPAHT